MNICKLTTQLKPLLMLLKLPVCPLPSHSFPPNCLEFCVYHSLDLSLISKPFLPEVLLT